MANSFLILGGVEGGGTKTTLTLMDENGEILAQVMGPSSNPLQVGFDKCAALIEGMVREAKSKANLPLELRLVSLGLCLSGIEVESYQIQLKESFIKMFPNLSNNYYINSDTRAPLALVSDEGGIVLISGTGSNCLRVNPNGSEVNCGGFGHELGDEGSAYWIAYKGIKICIDSISNFQTPPESYPIDKLWKTVQQFFRIENIYDLIPVFYSNFNKGKIAALCLEVSKLASQGDDLCKWLFDKAGRDLAKHIQAVCSPNTNKNLSDNAETIHVVCVGSVWNSWKLLKPGFEAQISKQPVEHIRNLSLLKTTVCGSIGACYLASKIAHLPNFHYHYEQNGEIFYKLRHQ